MILFTALIATVSADGLPMQVASPPRIATAARDKRCVDAKNRTGNATGRS
jgi:hypothetical protein